MRKNVIRLSLVLAFIVIGLLFAGEQALAADLTICGKCHDWLAKPNSDVTKFVLPKIADGSAAGSTVDKTRCTVCHTTDLLPDHMGFKFTLQTVNGVAYGVFTDQNSLYQTPSFLHNIHNGVALWKMPGPTCIKCHGVVSCTSCHDSIPHKDHYSANPVNPKTKTSIVTPVLNVVTGNLYNNNGNLESTWPLPTSCAAAECHQKLPAPQRFRPDGSDLCYNCHNTAKAGHTDTQLQTSHSTTLSSQLTFTTQLVGTYVVDCTGCHNSTLNVEHTNRNRDCLACHKSANRAVVDVIYNANGIIANRACEKCHFNPAALAPPTGTLRAEHKLFHIATQANNLRVAGTPHANCNTCHQRTTPISMQIVSGNVYTATTLAQLAGSTVKDYSCLSCHNGAPNPKAPIHQANYNGQAQKLTDFHPGCNTCHNPNVTYAKDPTRKPLNDVNTIIATKNGVYSCTDCHTNLAAGHQAQFNGTAMTTTDYHLDCATCHKSSDPFVTAAITTLKGTSGYTCQACHAATRTAATPPYSPLHSAKGDEITGYHTAKTCKSCHGVVNGAYKVNLSTIKPKTITTGYGCADCHGAMTGVPMGKHNGLTTAGAVYKDVSAKYHPTCATCHKDARVTAKITALKTSGVTSYLCSECHNTILGLAPKHQAGLSVSASVYGTVYEVTQFHIDTTGAVSCDKCHDNNAVLPTTTIGTLKTQPGYQCSSCHNAALAPNHKAALAATGTPEPTVGYHKDCVTCHTNSAVKISISTGAFRTSYLCTTCHNGAIAPQPNHMAKADANAASENISTTYHAACSKCHGNPNYPEVNNIIKQTAANKETDYLCTKCHNATLNLEPKHQAKMAVSDAAYATITDYHIDVTGKTACSMCHGTTKLPAGTITTLKAAPSYLCDDCHTPASVIKYSHTANYGTEATNQKTTDYHNACQTCHDSAQAKPVIKGLIGQTGYDCTQCHNGTTATKALHQAKTSATVTDAVYTVQYHPSCATCHSSNNTNVVNIITAKKGATVPYQCADCHTGNLSAKHNANWTVNSNVYGFETTQFHNNCDQCHLSSKPAVKTQIGVINASLQANPAATYNCTDCHSGTAAAQAKHQAGLTVGGTVYESTVFHAKLGTTVQESCFTCHKNSTVAAELNAIFTKVQTGQGYLCTDCHKNPATAPYTPNHSAVLDAETFNTLTLHPACTTCHTTAADTSIRTLKGQSGYSCNTCHTDVNAKHVSPSQLTGNMVNCSWCHTNQLIDTHINPTINLPKQMQCTTCHSAASPVRNQIKLGQKNCDSCHDGVTIDGIHPDKQYIPKHTAVFPAFMPEYSPNCVNCHYASTPGTTPNLYPLHAPYMVGCVTCHTNTAYKPAVTSQSTNCSGCHVKSVNPAMDMTAAHDNFHTVNVAVYQDSAQCLSCHKADTVVASAYTTYSSVNNLLAVHQKKPSYTKVANCDACHGTAARTEVKQAIAANNTNCTACHPSADHKHQVVSYEAAPDVNCVKCHSTGTDPANATVKTTELSAVHSKYGKTCATCHISPFLGNVIAGDGSIDMMKSGSTAIYCSTCHNGDTANGYPVAREAKHAPEHKAVVSENVNCSSCHDGISVKSIITAAVYNSENAFTGIHAGGCNTCHDNAKVDTVIASRVGKTNTGANAYNCAECHDGAKAKTHNKQHTVVSYLDTGNSTSCANCHNADISVLHSSVTKATLNCDTCHGANPKLPNTKPTIVANLSSKTATPNFTCQSCHSNAGAHNHPVEANGYETSPNVDCTSCHATEQATGKSELVKIHQDGLGTAFSCSTCHNTKFEGTVIVGDGTIDMLQNADPAKRIFCNTCHNGTLAPLRDTGHLADHKAQHSAANMDCTSCHGFTVPAGTATDISSVTIHKNGCNTCHGSATRADVKLIIASKKGQTNPVYTCEECHGGAIHVGWESKHQPVFPANQPAGDCAKCHNNYLPTEHEKALTASANNSIGYQVFRSTDNVNWTAIGSTTATGYADTGLAANTTYYYKVQAYDGKPNYSGFSNTVNIKTLLNTPVATTVNPDSARYANGSNNGDSSADPSSTSDVLASLTDSSNSSYSDVREDGSQDRYIFVQLNKEAGDYTKVELKMSVRYNNSTNLIIYPYQSNGTSINTSSTYYVKGASRSSSSSYITETIDVTKAAQAMKGFGWMKFRIKPDPNKSSTSVYIAKVELVLSQNPVSGGTATNPPGTLTPNSNDTAAPSTPSGLTGTTNYYDRVDLTWSASTDTGGVTGNTCAVCHSATARQQAKDAVTAKNANCSACHIIHADITTAHTGPVLPTTPSNCSGCHSNVLSVEHSNNAKLAHNATLNCDTCHNSTLAKVQAAIKTTVTDKSNLACTTCHTGTVDGATAPHSDLAAPHLTGIFPFALADADCLKCHTAQAAEFVATKAAYHVANGLTSKAASGWGTYISPWTTTSNVGCKGCHGNNNDGKAQVANILKRPYTYTGNSNQADMLCYLCHDRATYGGGTGTTGKSGFSEAGRNFHNIGDHKPNGILQCSWCHAAVPHATSKAHLIVTNTEPNSAGNLTTKFTHPTSGQYSKSNCSATSSLCAGDHP